MDRALLEALAAHLDRRVSWSLTRTDDQLFVDVAGETLTGTLERLRLPD